MLPGEKEREVFSKHRQCLTKAYGNPQSHNTPLIPGGNWLNPRLISRPGSVPCTCVYSTDAAWSAQFPPRKMGRKKGGGQENKSRENVRERGARGG